MLYAIKIIRNYLFRDTYGTTSFRLVNCVMNMCRNGDRMNMKYEKLSRRDLLMEIIWTLMIEAITFLYCMVFLLIISFVFQSMVNLSLKDMLYLSVIGTIGMLIYRIIKFFR